MKILMSGSSGLVGSVLVPYLMDQGGEVSRLVRSRPRLGESSEIFWDPAVEGIDPSSLEGFDAVIHLAGENLATGRWTRQKKARIRNSRIQSTRLLCQTLASADRPPKVIAAASGVGFYGHREDKMLTEESAPGTGFLSEVCQEWEAAAWPAVKRGIRVVHLRFGMILSREGGALAKMLPPFRCGLGGVLGNGRQYYSWIAIDDAVGVIQHTLVNERLSGALNVVSPLPVTNREFTKTLGQVLSRPTILSVPAFAVRIAFGEMADETLLASTRAEPVKLLGAGYSFRHPELAGALQHLLQCER
jgi:uncharacterized protein (TIGR01777 family)